MDIIRSWKNGDNGGDIGEDRGVGKSPCLNYGGFWFLYYLSKMDEIHIMCYMYMDEAGIPMLVTKSNE